MPNYNPDDFARSLPPMRLLERAGEGGNSLLEFLQKLRGSKGAIAPADELQRNRGQMSEPEYRKYLLDQLRKGQEMSDKANISTYERQSLPVSPTK